MNRTLSLPQFAALYRATLASLPIRRGHKMPSRVRAFGALGASIEMSSSFSKHTHVEALQRTTEHRQSMSQLKLSRKDAGHSNELDGGGKPKSPGTAYHVYVVSSPCILRRRFEKLAAANFVASHFRNEGPHPLCVCNHVVRRATG